MPREYAFHVPLFQNVATTIVRLSNARYVWALLFGLGLVRNVVLLFAYPPAHGADSFVYYLYVERLYGYDIPLISQTAPPLYPVVLYVAIHVLNSLYWLIGAQFIASAALAPLFYQALRRYNPPFALGVALIILGDTQVAVPFNLTSTEPLYITLLALSLALFLYAADTPARTRNVLIAAFAVGVLLVLLLLTRSVARYFIVAFALVMLLRTRDLRRTAALLAGFAVALGASLVLTLAAWGEAENTSTSNHLLLRVVVEKPEWVSSENGPYSARYLSLREVCPETRASWMRFCLLEQLDDWDETAELISGVYNETIRANWQGYLREIEARTEDFLSLSARQYGIDKEVPSDVQCRTVEAHVQSITADSLRRTWWAWILPDYPDYSEQTVQKIRDVQRRTLAHMCPPIPSSARLKDIVDYITLRYRSLGRPNPYNWYVAALAFAVLIPWARRYMTVVLISGGLLAMHALVSAVTFNVQPRYVMVTNPLRATLLLFVVYVAGMLVLHALDAVIVRVANRARDRTA